MVWTVQVFSLSWIPDSQIGLTGLVICSVGFLAVYTLADSVYAGLSLGSAGVALVLLGWVHFTADFAGREVATSGLSMAKPLASLALGGSRGRVVFLSP